MMLVAGFNALGVRGGDLIGTWIYDSFPANGMTIAVLTTVVLYALILPVTYLVPAALLATTDGADPART